MKNELKKYLLKQSANIQGELDSFLSHSSKYAATVHPKLEPFCKILHEHTQGGKKVRGALVLLGYQLGKPKKTSDIVKIAAAFEIVHTSLLIHDDIIDKSEKRRGKPSVYKALGGNHYAHSQAMCLGDLGFFLATKLISQTTFTPLLRTKILSLFSQMLHDTILGEMLDVELSTSPYTSKESEIITMHKMKTAHYTITWPLTIGAVLGRVKKKNLTAISQYGEALGIAFQIQDDILGIFGDEKQLGKSVTSDIAEAKNTLLISYALSHATMQQKNTLQKYYGDKHVTSKKHQVIKKIFFETGALSYSQKKAKEYIDIGKAIIPKITQEKQLQNYLEEFADYIVERKK